MAMKQTQTKLFDFSDVGLDFCAGSKNLFPDRFKRMLALGYNEQTVSSVAVAGNQVTLSYGVSHGYVADRVLKVNAPELLGINGGEFWIDSVTTNTVTMTIDDAPLSVAGNFTTRIAPLGWELVYENAYIHIYKFKHIDDTDMYARLCFQNATAAGNRNCIAVGIGRTVDLSLGHVTDPNCMSDLATCATVADATSNNRWDFTGSTADIFNNYTYSQGYSNFGKAEVVGSKYHLALFTNIGAYYTCGYTQGIFPTHMLNYSEFDYPLLVACNNNISAAAASSAQLQVLRFYVGKQELFAEPKTRLATSIATGSFLSVDAFNTTAAKPLLLYEANTGQITGVALGLYQSMYASSDRPDILPSTIPVSTVDINLSNIVKIHACSASTSEHAWFAVPVEEIKIAN